jgi:GNAT superfamily N-acetyltransferase
MTVAASRRLDDIARQIAALHAASWKATYRGIFADDYLDNEVDAERLGHWRARVHELAGGEGEIFLATVAGVAAGFACIDIGPDRHWGALVDNLHVLPPRKGAGIGAALLEAAGNWARARGQRQMHLWVYAGNHAAQRFYAWHGWREAERRAEEVPGGGKRIVLRMVKPI